jgi:hypothetical protein
MTYIRVDIKINEAKIREEAIKFYSKIETYCKHHYREVFNHACEVGQRHGSAAVLGRIHKLLGHTRSNLEGTIACDCKRRSCPGYTLSIRTFTRKLKSVS